MAAITAAVIAGLGSVAGGTAGLWGPQGPSGMRTGDMIGALDMEAKYRPIDYSAGLQQLLAQSSYGVGADPTQLSIDLLTRQIESSANPAKARDFQKRAQAVQSLLMQQQSGVLGKKGEKQLAKMMAEMNKILGKRGLGMVSIGSGGLEVSLADKGLQQIVNEAQASGAGIRADRLTAEQNLAKLAADFPTATAAQLDALTGDVRTSQLRELETSYGKDAERIMAEANMRGYNPAGVLAELNRNRADAAFDTQFTAADRALQILTGRQQGAMGSITGINTALSPDRLLAIQNSLKGQQTPTTGQLAAAQLAALNGNQSTAASDAGSGIAAGAAAFSDSLLLSSILGRNQSNPGPGASTDYGLSDIMNDLYAVTGNGERNR